MTDELVSGARSILEPFELQKPFGSSAVAQGMLHGIRTEKLWDEKYSDSPLTPGYPSLVFVSTSRGICLFLPLPLSLTFTLYLNFSHNSLACPEDIARFCPSDASILLLFSFPFDIYIGRYFIFVNFKNKSKLLNLFLCGEHFLYSGEFSDIGNF